MRRTIRDRFHNQRRPRMFTCDGGRQIGPQPKSILHTFAEKQFWPRSNGSRAPIGIVEWVRGGMRDEREEQRTVCHVYEWRRHLYNIMGRAAVPPVPSSGFNEPPPNSRPYVRRCAKCILGCINSDVLLAPHRFSIDGIYAVDVSAIKP